MDIELHVILSKVEPAET